MFKKIMLAALVVGTVASGFVFADTPVINKKIKNQRARIHQGVKSGKMTAAQAAPWGQLFVTATGNVNVFRREHFAAMREGAIMANSGHFDAGHQPQDFRNRRSAGAADILLREDVDCGRSLPNLLRFLGRGCDFDTTELFKAQLAQVRRWVRKILRGLGPCHE